MVYCDILWYTVIYCDILLLYCNTQKKKAEGPAELQQPAKKMKPTAETMPTVSMETMPSDPEALKQQIDAQGTKVRDLKSCGAEKVICTLS